MIYCFAQLHKPHYDYSFTFLENEEGNWNMDAASLLRVREWVVENAKTSTQHIVKLYDQWRTYCGDFTQLCDNLREKELSSLSDKELYEELKNLYECYLLAGSVAYVTDCFMSRGEEDFFEQLLAEQGVAKDIVSQIDSLSYTLQSQQELVDLGKCIKKNYGTFPLFDDLSQDFKDELKNHEERYFWIQNNYHHVHYVSAQEFYKQIPDLKETKAEKKEIPPQEPFVQNLLNIAQLFSGWKDVRKSGVAMGAHFFDVFLKEIARRTAYSADDLSFLIFHEIKPLLDGEDFKDIIALRRKKCFFSVNADSYFVCEGEEAEKYFAYKEKEDYSQLVELKGVVACKGNATGKVRVILKTGDMKDFKEGEILVANQTTPEFVPIMKKAAAIITEQGGITSHAAVVSRELNVPCIIGTKIATKILKNGQEITVDAEKGMVRL
ncbi:hypothetical protein GOV09_01965 [Candidatus Woesearchaeota archaeon]|nr:hypothetical protein [Candidatus Woesearchaeota archaeon]